MRSGNYREERPLRQWPVLCRDSKTAGAACSRARLTRDSIGDQRGQGAGCASGTAVRDARPAAIIPESLPIAAAPARKLMKVKPTR
jgi:hypothetical protein